MAMEYLVIYDQSLPSNVVAQIKSICSAAPSVSVSQKMLESVTYLFDNAYDTVSSAYWTSSRDSVDLLIHHALPPAYFGQLDKTDLSIFDKMDKAYTRMTILWAEAGNLDNELNEHLVDVAQNYGVKNTNLPETSPYCFGNNFFESMDIMKETIEEIFDGYRIYDRRPLDE
jgi:hypothetical protein